MLAKDGPSRPVRLAVVEDDAEFRDEVLLPILSRAGFAVTALGSALELYRPDRARGHDQHRCRGRHEHLFR